MNRHSWLLFCCFCLLLSCKENDNKKTTSADLVYLQIKTKGLGLREAAGENQKLIKRLAEGERVLDLGKVSDFTSKIKFEEKWLDEPWLYVQTSDNQKGWVYAGGVSLVNSDPNSAYHFWADKQLEALFGSALYQQILELRKQYSAVKTDSDFAKVYAKSDTIRTALCDVLSEKVVMDENGNLPNFSYLDVALPGFVTTFVAEGTQYFLFRDFKHWLSVAQKTSGKTDDDFLHFEIETSTDSIEYQINNWDMMLSDVEAASLLGDGVHLRYLKSLNKQSVVGNPFLPLIQKYKEELINDICGVGTELYWNSSDKILSEIQAIQNSNLNTLTSNDKVALQARLKVFERNDPIVKTNLRAGNE